MRTTTDLPTWTSRGRCRGIVTTLVASVLIATACGAAESGPSATAMTAAPSPTAAPAPAAFPVSIEHKYGSTEIPSEPGRVVALGYTELDYVLALGYQPVAARYPQFGDRSTAVRSWAEDLASGPDPEVLEFAFGELNFEKIATLDPDLILAVTSGITEEEYQTLSAIAPTVAQTDEFVDFGMPWQEVTRHLGRALGRSSEAEDLVADVEALFAQARDAHPQFKAKSLATVFYGGSELLAFSSQDLRGRFFTSLGFDIPEVIDTTAGESFFATFSKEQAEVVDTDVLVWSQLQFTDGGRDAIEADPILQGLDATREGRVIYIGGEVDDAYQVASILSLPAALDGILPMLERATDADPATEPSPRE